MPWTVPASQRDFFIIFATLDFDASGRVVLKDVFFPSIKTRKYYSEIATTVS